MCSSLVFFPIINLQQKTQTQILTKPQTHIPSKENLSLQTYKFSWQTNTKKTHWKEKLQITTTESKNMKIKTKKKNRNPATSKAPPLNQIIHYHINETTPKPNHPKNRNPTKHPTHPLPNQTIIKETSNTTTS